MIQGALQPSIAPPDDPVRATLDDPGHRNELMAHAVARLLGLLSDRPAAVRSEVAADAVQEALTRAWHGRATFDPAAGVSVAGWVHGILNNVLSEHCRKLRKQPAQPPADPADWENLAARMEPADAPGELGPLLAGLPEGPRQIVTWHHLEGLSHREIADRLGIGEPCSRVRLTRAMNDLKQLATGKEVGR